MSRILVFTPDGLRQADPARLRPEDLKLASEGTLGFLRMGSEEFEYAEVIARRAPEPGTSLTETGEGAIDGMLYEIVGWHPVEEFLHPGEKPLREEGLVTVVDGAKVRKTSGERRLATEERREPVEASKPKAK